MKSPRLGCGWERELFGVHRLPITKVSEDVVGRWVAQVRCACGFRRTPPRGSNPRPQEYEPCALPTEIDGPMPIEVALVRVKLKIYIRHCKKTLSPCWLEREAVNLKVGSSSLPGSVLTEK